MVSRVNLDRAVEREFGGAGARYPRTPWHIKQNGRTFLKIICEVLP